MLWAQQDSRPLIQFTLAPLWEDEGIALAVMGILVVFMALILVSTFISLLPRLVPELSRETPQMPEHMAPSTDGDELSEETLVVIAAAVAETIRQPHRVVFVRGLTPEDLGWSLEGRIQLHQSHRVQRRDRR